MAPLIALFNHKGGVSKTTTAFNLGWALAERGKRILIVDADPQCNLTGTVVGFDKFDDISTFYSKHRGANISDCLDPIFKATGTTLQAARMTKTPNPNLFLLAGSIDLAESETQISVALSTREAIPCTAKYTWIVMRFIAYYCDKPQDRRRHHRYESERRGDQSMSIDGQ